ncbi:MAG: hypothetical protein ABIP95_07865, partial [Pelobium sp.]
SRIFFSIWVSDETLKTQKIFYNIHALKLRKLKTHQIESRKFAENFRNRFKEIANDWPNVSTKFGPLTLMEGWVTIDENQLEIQVLTLANHLIALESILEDSLSDFNK